MRGKREMGFSLVEMLVVTSVLAFASAGVQSLVSRGNRNYAIEKEKSEVVGEGRAAVEQMVRELRLAGHSSQASPDSEDSEDSESAVPSDPSVPSAPSAAAFLVATATQIVFDADLDGNGVAERVEYRLNGAVLERSAVSRNADGSVPEAQYAVLAGNVTNGVTPVFSYTTEPAGATPPHCNVQAVRVRLELQPPIRDPKTRASRTFLFEGIANRGNPQS